MTNKHEQTPQTVDLLDKLFQHMSVKASISRNSQGQDTLNLDVPEHNKVFVFDNTSGEYLGMLKRAAPAPATTTQLPEHPLAKLTRHMQLQPGKAVGPVKVIRLGQDVGASNNPFSDLDDGDSMAFDALSIMEKMFGR